MYLPVGPVIIFFVSGGNASVPLRGRLWSFFVGYLWGSVEFMLVFRFGGNLVVEAVSGRSFSLPAGWYEIPVLLRVLV
jgi:hypothetical protein